MFRANPFARVAVAFAAVVAVVVLGAPAAQAASDSDITWSVTPATESGPDKRGVIRQELDPGASREDFFAVRNLSRTEVTFALSAADGYYTDTGRFNMLPADQESVDAGLWIDLPPSVTVAPNATVVVPFATTVPDGALPGDHAAGIAASVESTGTDASGAKVGVESRVGFRVMTRVTGDIVPSFAVTGAGSGYDMSWNPFQSGSGETSFTVENTGNASLQINGTVAIGTGSAVFPAEGVPRLELLPGESRSFTVAVDGVWPTLFVPGTIDVTPEARGLADAAVEVAPQSVATSLWVVPVPQLLVLLGLALLAAALFWRRRRFTAALDRAREEGRLAASSGVATTPPVGTAPDDAGRLRSRVGAGRAPTGRPDSGEASTERLQ
jgi:hypothetical protein